MNIIEAGHLPVMPTHRCSEHTPRQRSVSPSVCAICTLWRMAEENPTSARLTKLHQIADTHATARRCSDFCDDTYFERYAEASLTHDPMELPLRGTESFYD